MPELNIKLTIDGKEANATLDVTKEQLDDIVTKLKDVPKNPPITPAMAGSVAELKDKLKTLTKEYESVEVGSQRFKELDVEINKVKGQLDEVYKKNQNVNKTPPIAPAAVGTVAALKEKLQSLTKEYESVQIGSQRFKELDAEIKKTKSDLEDIYKEKPAAPAESSITKIGMAITGLNQGLELARKGFEMLSKPLEKAGQFEQYETALKVMLGSADAAKARLAELVDFAKTTPFELPQVVSAANQLQALGKYSKDNLTMLGDLASASGKPMEQALSAYAKMMTGQKGIAIDMFRDLLITADDWTKATGKKIGKNGELQASVEEMAAALPKIIQQKGFSGMMDAQSQTLLGMTSNFQDAFGQLQTKLGNMMMPVAKDILNMLTPALSGLQNNLGVVITTAEIGAVTFVTYEVAVNGATVATKAMEVASIGVKKAIDAIKLAMANNPWAIAATVIATAVAGAYMYIKALEDAGVKEAELAQQRAQDDIAANKQKESLLQKNIQQAKSENDLIDKYRQLYSETMKLHAGSSARIEKEKELREILSKISKQYPELISTSSDFGHSQDILNSIRDKNISKEQEYQKTLKETIALQATLANNKFWADYGVKVEQAVKQLGNVGISVNNQAVNLTDAFKSIAYSGTVKERTIGLQQLLGTIESEVKTGQIRGNITDTSELNNLKAKVQEVLLTLNEKTLTDLNGPSSAATAKKPEDKKESPFEKAKEKELEDIKKYNAKIAEEERVSSLEYIEIQEELLKKKEGLADIDKKIASAKDQKSLDKLKFERDLTLQSIAILEAEGKKKEEEFSKQMDTWRKGQEEKFKAEEEALKKEKELKKEEEQLIADSTNNEHDRRVKELDNWYNEEIEKFAGHEEAKLQINRAYNQKRYQLEVETFNETHKLEAAALDGLLSGFQTTWGQFLMVNRQAKDGWDAVWLAMENTALQSVGNIISKYLENLIMEQVIGSAFKKAEIASAVATGSAIAAAYAPAAAFASIMSFGGADLAGSAGLTATTALAYGLAIPKFAKGGLVEGTEKLIKINEKGPEFVVNHDATMKNLPLLHDINQGKDLSATSTFTQILYDMSAVKMAADTKQAALNVITAGNSFNDKNIISAINELSSKIQGIKLHVGDRDCEDINNRSTIRFQKES